MYSFLFYCTFFLSTNRSTCRYLCFNRCLAFLGVFIYVLGFRNATFISWFGLLIGDGLIFVLGRMLIFLGKISISISIFFFVFASSTLSTVFFGSLSPSFGICCASVFMIPCVG